MRQSLLTTTCISTIWPYNKPQRRWGSKENTVYHLNPPLIKLMGIFLWLMWEDILGHGEGNITHFSMTKCNQKLSKVWKGTSINLSWRPYVGRTDASQAADTLERAQIPLMGTTYGLCKSGVENEYDELLPLLVLLFILDSKTEVPAEKIKSILYSIEPSPARSHSPVKWSCREEWPAPGDEEDPGQRNTRQVGFDGSRGRYSSTCKQHCCPTAA